MSVLQTFLQRLACYPFSPQFGLLLVRLLNVLRVDKAEQAGLTAENDARIVPLVAVNPYLGSRLLLVPPEALRVEQHRTVGRLML